MIFHPGGRFEILSQKASSAIHHDPFAARWRRAAPQRALEKSRGALETPSSPAEVLTPLERP